MPHRALFPAMLVNLLAVTLPAIGADDPRPPPPRSGSAVDARSFGTLGNGRDLDTVAIQRAIDACAAGGGGEVHLAGGTYLTGTLRLRSRVTLHLAAGAVLLGSPEMKDYAADERQKYGAEIIAKVLVFAEGCEQVGIRGPGAIDGNGSRFSKAMTVPRPVLVRFRDCRQVVVRDCTLRHGASWALHAVGCRQVRLVDLTIDNLLHLTSDGLDIDSSEEVFVSRCSIASGDDSIALKATEVGRPCRDVTISDCQLRSYCAGIRLGPETVADIERVTVNNCIVRDTGMGGIVLQMAHGSRMRDLIFSNLLMDNVTGPIAIRLAGWHSDPATAEANQRPWTSLNDSRWKEGRLSDVLFSNIRARVPRYYLQGTPKESRTFKAIEKSCISITGTPHTRPSRITFDQVDVTFDGGGTAEEAARAIPELERTYPTPFMFGVLPAYGLYLRHVDDVALHRVRFRLAAADARPALLCDDARRCDVSGLEADGEADKPAVRARNRSSVVVSAAQRCDADATSVCRQRVAMPQQPREPK